MPRSALFIYSVPTHRQPCTRPHIQLAEFFQGKNQNPNFCMDLRAFVSTKASNNSGAKDARKTWTRPRAC